MRSYAAIVADHGIVIDNTLNCARKNKRKNKRKSKRKNKRKNKRKSKRKNKPPTKRTVGFISSFKICK